MSVASRHVLTVPHKTRALRDYLFFKAAEARESIPKFIEFAMRDYTKPSVRIKLAPHQYLGLEFLEAHHRALLLWPPGASKTFLLAARHLWEIGHDPTHRVAVISATMEQASRVLNVFRRAIEENPFVRLVFPKLRRKEGDKWTSTDLVIERPAGIADATIMAFGLDTDRPLGKRLSRLIVDDAVTWANTRTKEAREQAKNRMELVGFSRLDEGGRAVFANNPWHPQDMVHLLKEEGWPMLRYDAYGDIEIQDDRSRIVLGFPEWDSDLVRRKFPNDNKICRLVAHDPDPTNEKLLWPEKFSHAYLNEKKANAPGTFDQMFRSIVRDDETALCKREYIEKCKKNALENGFTTLVSKYNKTDELIFTGVDLAFGQGDEHDDNAIVTIAVMPRLKNMRVLLNMQVGKWASPETLKRIEQVNRDFHPDVIMVENNGAQRMLRQFGLQKDLGLPLRPYTTTAMKAHPDFGIPNIFWEFDNGAWALPCNQRGEVHPLVQRLIDSCLYYVGTKHVDDPLMGLFFAFEQARKFTSYGDPPPPADGDVSGSASAIVSNIMSR